MPPNSYPLQNTLPFIIILISRMLVLRLSEQRETRKRALYVSAWLSFVLAMSVGEFALLFGTALLAAEYIAWLARAHGRDGKLVGAIQSLLRSRSFWSDVAAVATVLTAYLSYRALSANSYEGNTVEGLGNIGRLLETLFRHIVGGTIAFRDSHINISTMPTEAITAAVTSGVCAAIAFFMLYPSIKDFKAPALTAAAALISAIYVTLPLALTRKQQDWCLVDNVCGYLDSRISYMALAILFLAAIALGRRLTRRFSMEQAFRILVCLAFGVMSFLTYAHNWQISQNMRQVHRAWKHANILSCTLDIHHLDDNELVRRVDPDQRVLPHHIGWAADFWRDYLVWRRASTACQYSN